MLPRGWFHAGGQASARASRSTAVPSGPPHPTAWVTAEILCRVNVPVVERTTLAGPLPRGQWQIFRNPTAHRAHLAAREPATCYHELRAVQLRFVLQLPAQLVKALCLTRTHIRAQVQLLTGKAETWARASRQAILVAYS